MIRASLCCIGNLCSCCRHDSLLLDCASIHDEHGMHPPARYYHLGCSTIPCSTWTVSPQHSEILVYAGTTSRTGTAFRQQHVQLSNRQSLEIAGCMQFSSRHIWGCRLLWTIWRTHSLQTLSVSLFIASCGRAYNFPMMRGLGTRGLRISCHGVLRLS